MALTGAQVYALAVQGGFSPAQAVVATAIARAESGWNPGAVGDTTLANATWGPSIGLWQVRSLKAQTGTGGTRDATRLTDPAFNARSAYQVYRDAGSFRPWSVFTSGAYSQYLGQAQAAQTGAGNVSTGAITLPTSGSSSSAGGATVVTPAGLFGDGGAVDPFGWAGALTSGVAGDLLGDAASAGASKLWTQVQPFLVTGAVAVLGLTLLGAGLLVTAWPTTRTTGAPA